MMQSENMEDRILTLYGPSGVELLTLGKLAQVLEDIRRPEGGVAIPDEPEPTIHQPAKPAPVAPVSLNYNPIGTIDGDVLAVCMFGGILIPVQRLGGPVERFMARGSNVVRDYGGVKLTVNPLPPITGATSGNYGLDEPGGFEDIRPDGFARKYFKDNSRYFERSTDSDQMPPNGGLPPTGRGPVNSPVSGTPAPVRPTAPLRTGPDNKQPAATGPRGELTESGHPSAMSDAPYGYDRQQVEHPAYEDDWDLKSSGIALANAPGFPDETPDLLRKHGHNTFITDWFYGGEGRAPWGLPKATDRLFFEVTGNCWNPYRTAFDVLTTDLQTLGKSYRQTLPQWNSVPENGLIDGVATVRECHFNPEYAWLGENGNGDRGNFYGQWSEDMRNRSIINYAEGGKTETLRTIYERGGVDAINQALHQKWRNIVGLSIQIINRHGNGIRAYYGDWKGIAPLHSIVDFSGNYNLSDLFSSDVNDGSRFSEANEQMNGGLVRLDDNESYDLTGNLRRLAGRSHAYDYEWNLSMQAKDYEAMMAERGRGDIRVWQDKMVPGIYRPYNMALHAQLTDYVRRGKGWDDYRVYWQTEPIYEHNIVVSDGREDGAWAGFTLDAQQPFAPCKLPLHEEVAAGLVYNARMHLNGLFMWESYRRQNLLTGRSENTHPLLHQTGREGLQRALDTINQHRAFGPDTIRLNGNVPIWNETKKEWLAGDASQLLLRNGKGQDGKPARPIPLVNGVFRPSTGLEVYQVYFPHQNRHDQTAVRFKSAVDGKELNAVATGWGPTLWTR